MLCKDFVQHPNNYRHRLIAAGFIIRLELIAASTADDARVI
jgi:hypothetical protein